MKNILRTFSSVWQFLKRLGTKRKWVTAVAVLVVVGGVGFVLFGPQPETEELATDGARTVSLIPVSEFSQGTSRGSGATGSESVVRAETSGKIVSVLPVGTRVSSGTTIAQFENAGQRAALLQAEGTLDAVKAALEKTQGGLRSEKIAILETAVTSSENAAVATLLSAYGTVDSAIRDTADQMFSNAETSAPKINFASSNNQRRNELENTRVALGVILARQSAASVSLSTDSNIAAELTATENELREVRAFMDNLVSALNEAIPTGSITSAHITSYKTAATTARTALTGALSSIASARGALETAKQNLEEGLTGAEDTDLAAAAAAVKQAQGAYNGALAAYQKTIVSAPSSGTIRSCNASTGDVLSVGSDVCRLQTAAVSSDGSFILPLASVKYTPTGAIVFVVNHDGVLESISVETGLVAATGITVSGLSGDEFIVSDVRGLKAGEKVNLQ